MKEAKIIPFRTKEERMAEARFRHLSDHLFNNPCENCIDIDSEFCHNECPTMVRKAIIKDTLKNTKSF